MTAVHLLNRSPTSALDGKTPYEAWHGRKPAVSYLRIFGCLAFVKELNHVGKLDDRNSPGVFICYAEGAKAYRVLDPATRRVRVTSCSMKDAAGHGTRRWTTGRRPRSVTSPSSTGGWAVLREHKVHPRRRLGLHHQRRPLHQLRLVGHHQI